MTIEDRLGDAELLWRHGRREGALLSALVAVAATAQRAFPKAGDGDAFRRFLRTHHEWSISVEYRGAPIDLDQLFWKWLRCELVHAGRLPPDLRVDDHFADPPGLSVRAGGAPEYIVLVTPGWFTFLTNIIRNSTASR